MAKTPAQTTKSSRGPKSPANAAKAAPQARTPAKTAPLSSAPGIPRGKLGTVVGLIRRPEGATIEALTVATGWQPHSVRGAISGALKKKLGLAVISEKTDAGWIYRMQDQASA